MPFTPFHMGPAAALKAVAGSYFSLTVFGFAQILMDLEPLVRLIRGDAILHGFSHTYLGATGVGFVAFAAGRPFCQGLLRCWNWVMRPKFFGWLRASAGISKTAAATGAFIGTYSHVFLDSLVHRDVRPWAPFNPANGWLGAIPAGWLHLVCLGLGVVGMMVLFVLWVWNRIAIEVD
jgi:hypothetical protein